MQIHKKVVHFFSTLFYSVQFLNLFVLWNLFFLLSVSAFMSEQYEIPHSIYLTQVIIVARI